MKKAFVPDGWQRVTPRLVAHEAAKLVDFVRRVFDAKGDYQKEGPAEMQIGESRIMISDAGVRPPMTGCLYVYVPDADAAYRRAVELGARSIEEPLDTPYGDRRAMVEDRWGNTWQIATRL